VRNVSNFGVVVESLDLTQVEFRLLHLLSKSSISPCSRSRLVELIYRDEGQVADLVLDTHLKKLSEKLTKITQVDHPIQLVGASKYRLAI